MAELFINNFYLILLLPLWIFLTIMIGRFFSVYVSKKIIYILTLASSLFGMVVSAGALWKLPPESILNTQFQFIKINDFMITCGLHIDKLSLIFALTLFFISFVVQLFSISYMQGEKKNYRFYGLINLFNFSMAGLFFSPNLFQTYFFWEIAGVVSYLLVGFEYFKSEKSIASKKVFLMNRVGDIALLGAIIICSYFMYSYAPNKTFTTLDFVDLNTISTLVYAYTSTPLFWIVCFMFLIGAFVKSAQIPFYTWLQDAMEAKLPVSALLHSATMVATGVFLTLRLLPFYTLENNILNLISIVGILTALICSLSACSQTNPKKTLAYSTSAQLGLMFFAIGLLNIRGAIAFFIAHAFIKSLLFIALPKQNEKWNYIKFITFLVSGLSLSGLLFAGMISKEIIAFNLNNADKIIFSMISFLTAFYIVRIALVCANKNELEKKYCNIYELISFILLFVANIIFYIYLRKHSEYQIAESFWAALTAWICVYILYSKNAFRKIPIFYPLTYNGFYLDKFYTKFCVKMYGFFANICSTLDIRILANYKPIINFAKILVKIFDLIENYIMNGIIKIIVDLFKNVSIIYSKAQNGNIQNYNAYAFIIITIIITSLILAYLAMLIYFGG